MSRSKIFDSPEVANLLSHLTESMSDLGDLFTSFEFKTTTEEPKEDTKNNIKKDEQSEHLKLLKRLSSEANRTKEENEKKNVAVLFEDFMKGAIETAKSGEFTHKFRVTPKCDGRKDYTQELCNYLRKLGFNVSINKVEDGTAIDVIVSWY